jgi:glutamine synthetase
MRRWIEYIWLDYLNNYRSKTRILNYDGSNGPFCIERIPIWNFDGSSTQQADGEDSEVYIKPVYMVRDPFRRGKDSWLVLCDTWLPDGEPHPDNTRVTAMKVFSQQPVIDSETWFGLEQEFFITKSGLPMGMDHFTLKDSQTKNIQGPYYCGVGTGNCHCREFMDEAVKNMADSGLNITGLNFEVAPGQAEFQIMTEGIDAADELHLARYILIRTAEKNDLTINLHPKPFKTNLNGSGCHTNYSTKAMREDGGYDIIIAAIKKLEEKHKEHIAVYGVDNDMRLSGKWETADINTFTYGVADRGASVRIPRFTERDKKGYLEDRRPASNMDPYLVTAKIAETTLL